MCELCITTKEELQQESNLGITVYNLRMFSHDSSHHWEDVTHDVIMALNFEFERNDDLGVLVVSDADAEMIRTYVEEWERFEDDKTFECIQNDYAVNGFESPEEFMEYWKDMNDRDCEIRFLPAC